jgi:hypothetical protein
MDESLVKFDARAALQRTVCNAKKSNSGRIEILDRSASSMRLELKHFLRHHSGVPTLNGLVFQPIRLPVMERWA